MSCIFAITLEHFPFFVFRIVPPVISSRGGTVTVVVNEPARLECEATGVPLPSLTWLKDGSPVASVSHGLQVPVNPLKLIHVSEKQSHTFVSCNFNVLKPPQKDCGFIYINPNLYHCYH